VAILLIRTIHFLNTFLLLVFRTILKKYNLAAGDFPDLQKFSEKLVGTFPSFNIVLRLWVSTVYCCCFLEVKFSEFSTLSTKQIAELDTVLNSDIPLLMSVRVACKENGRSDLFLTVANDSSIPGTPQ
jgi:hypothetical protein